MSQELPLMIKLPNKYLSTSKKGTAKFQSLVSQISKEEHVLKTKLTPFLYY